MLEFCYSLPYLLLLVPLLTSIMCCFFKQNAMNFFIALTTIVFLICLSTYLAINILSFGHLDYKVNESILSIISEYRLGLFNIFFVLVLLFVKLLSLLYFRYEIKHYNNQRFFYALFLINCFGLLGILLTNNIFNLYVYLEIYSFTFYALITNYDNEQSADIAIKYFFNGVVGSIFILFSLTCLYVLFQTSDISYIFQKVNNVSVENYLILSCLFLIFVCGIFSKFFTFWLYLFQVKKSKNVINFLFITLMFLHIFIGLYLLIKSIFFIFGVKIVFGFMSFDIVLSVLGCIMVVYYSYCLIKTRNLFQIVSYLCIINLGFILINIGLGNVYSLASAFLFILEYLSSNLMLFIFVSYLIYNFDSSDINFLNIVGNKKNIILSLAFLFAILAKTIIPIGTGFTNKLFYAQSLGKGGVLAGLTFLIPMIFNVVIIGYVCFKFIKVMKFSKYNKGIYYDLVATQNKGSINKIYIYSLHVLLVFSILITVFSGSVAELSYAAAESIIQ